MNEHEADSGWRAFSPADPDLPGDLRAMCEASRSSRVLGEVHVFVHELRPGGSEVRVGGEASEVELIDAAITELQEARCIFRDDEDDVEPASGSSARGR